MKDTQTNQLSSTEHSDSNGHIKSIEIDNNWTLQSNNINVNELDTNGTLSSRSSNDVTINIPPPIEESTNFNRSQSVADFKTNGSVTKKMTKSPSMPWIATKFTSKLKNKVKQKESETDDEDAKWLSWVEKQFAVIAGEDQEIDLAEFKKALKVKQSFFAERFFQLFDQDKSGSIELSELMDGLTMLTKGSPTEKLKFLFDVYDVDGSGTISPEELKTVLKSCMEESSLQLSEDNLDALTMALFESADDDNSGEITFDELKEELEKHPGIIDNLTISAAQWLKPPDTKKKKGSWVPRYLTVHYLQNNVRKVVFFLVYVLLNIGLFTLSAVRYRDRNWCLVIARGCGMCLNFNCTFILVLMLRKCLTFLRGTRLAHFLPLDQNIMFHKLVGVFIAVQSAVHTFAHLGNVWFMMEADTKKQFQYWEYLFTIKPNIGWVWGLAPLSGVVLDIILVIMVVCSMNFVRRGGHFQVFYWTHMLYLPFFILCIIHGPLVWMFFCVPGFIFIIEKLSNSEFVKLARFGRTYVKEVNLLPSKVTHLVITRPKNFRYRPGDYVFIRIPAIAQHEWHPFTISSAPEMKGEFWVHIRSVGHWTNKLYEYFDKYEEVTPESNIGKRGKDNAACTDHDCGVIIKSIKHTGDTLNKTVTKSPTKSKSKKSSNKKCNVRIFIDGPYGTSTREIFETDHAVLVGAGIGVTPYASILQSVMYRYKMSRRQCPECQHCWYDEIPTMNMKKVDFVWINRDQKSFEWFVSLLAKIEMEQMADGGLNRLIEMHMYMTAAMGKNDMKGVGLQMALEILHKKDNVDLITGLKTRTQAGRPDWSEIFQKLAAEKKGKVKIFFCGSPALGKVLKAECEKFKFAFCKENF